MRSRRSSIVPRVMRADVEQVVDQPHHVRDLALQRLRRLAHRRGVTADEAQDLDDVRDRRQRVAQLVGQDGEELVLAPVGLAQRLFVTRDGDQVPGE